jgi:hypothetical protein
MSNTENKPKLLLHICCAGCGAYVADLLKADYEPALFFYNPNIYPEKEHQIRLEEAKSIASYLNIPFYDKSYNHNKWLKLVAGLENEPEKGTRCDVCYFERLAITALEAKNMGYTIFTSTLSVSPHKKALTISEIGLKLQAKTGVRFLDQDFKKKNGFYKSVQLSKKLGLYRQNYCGCEFSIKQAE